MANANCFECIHWPSWTLTLSNRWASPSVQICSLVEHLQWHQYPQPSQGKVCYILLLPVPIILMPVQLQSGMPSCMQQHMMQVTWAPTSTLKMTTSHQHQQWPPPLAPASLNNNTVNHSPILHNSQALRWQWCPVPAYHPTDFITNNPQYQ